MRAIFGSHKIAPYVFVAPFIITFALFLAYPIANTFVMSFQELLPGSERFVGFQNYKALWNDNFLTAIGNSAEYTFWTLFVLIPLPLLLAVWLNSTRMVARNFFRSTLFLPALTSIIVGGAIFRLIFGSLETAPMNSLMIKIGLEAQKWTMQEHTGMLLMVLLASWRWLGVNIIYFLSGLQNIPKNLYEAAEIDGAGAVKKFWFVTVPMLKPVSIYVLTISIYGGFAMFTESYVFWNTKSPDNIGLTIVGYLYQQGFEFFNMGFAAAVGVVLLMGVLVLNLIQLVFFGQFRKEG